MFFCVDSHVFACVRARVCLCLYVYVRVRACACVFALTRAGLAHNNNQVLPGEGGHATFAPRGAEQRGLAAYVEARDGFCEVESVLCGSGIVTIYDYLREGREGEVSHTCVSVFVCMFAHVCACVHAISRIQTPCALR